MPRFQYKTGHLSKMADNPVMLLRLHAFCELCSMCSAKNSLVQCASQLKTKDWDHKKVSFIPKCKNHAKSKGTAAR